ncbi:hypothetical protein [Streptomyces sp. NPDC018693]|uniref:hypothetical protein n=1 Tax=unclassified Streptomyces TaxID=2593676 RepID=UPI0037B30107
MSGDQLLALRTSEDRITPTALVSLDPESGEETPYRYFSLPEEAAMFILTDSHDVIVQNGRLFFGVKVANGPTGKPKQWIWFVLGIQSLKANG